MLFYPLNVISVSEVWDANLVRPCFGTVEGCLTVLSREGWTFYRERRLNLVFLPTHQTPSNPAASIHLPVLQSPSYETKFMWPFAACAHLCNVAADLGPRQSSSHAKMKPPACGTRCLPLRRPTAGVQLSGLMSPRYACGMAVIRVLSGMVLPAPQSF